MLEVNMDRRLLLVLIGVFAVIGVISKFVVSISLKSLMKAAGNMGKSSHSLMRLVRAKYEHTCMVSDRVQNVGVFVEKYIYEYRIMRIRLHSWRRLERAAAWGCLMAGLVGAGIEYAFMGMTDFVLQSAGGGAAIGILLFLMRVAMDEEYCLNVIRTYMVDYLDNFCARKFEKTRELNNPERPRPREEVPSPADPPEILPPVMPEPYQQPEPYRAPEAGTAPEGLRMAERREYVVGSRGERVIDNRTSKWKEAVPGQAFADQTGRQAEMAAGRITEEQMGTAADRAMEEQAGTAAGRMTEEQMGTVAGRMTEGQMGTAAGCMAEEQNDMAAGRGIDEKAEAAALQAGGRGYDRDRGIEERVERISERLMENIVETAVADTKWAEAGGKEGKPKGKKTARGRKKEQQLAERLAEKAVEKSMEAAAERAAEKLAADAEADGSGQTEGGRSGGLSKEVLIREILEEFLA